MDGDISYERDNVLEAYENNQLLGKILFLDLIVKVKMFDEECKMFN